MDEWMNIYMYMYMYKILFVFGSRGFLKAGVIGSRDCGVCK